MKLPDQAIKEFQEAWQAAFGENISTEQAATEGSKLIAIYSILSNPNEHEYAKPRPIR